MKNNYLANNFNVLEQIGEGANAIVFKAEQKSTQQIVAIKKLKIDKYLEQDKIKKMVARFKRETEICGQLNHPNIVKVIDTGIDDEENPFAVYEYVSGETLKSYIQKKGKLTANETKVLMEQVLEALCAAHEKGIVHRDLKPQNIMVFTSGSKTYVKVLDFGIGAITHQFKPFDQTQLTMTEDVLGTPVYAAPEQLRGGIPNTQSDLYAWGLITLECLTGTTVLSGNTLAEVFHQHLALSNIPLPSAIVDHEVGVFLRTVLQKSLEKRASDTNEVLARFQALNFSTLVGTIGVKKVETNEASTEISHLNSVLPKTSKKNLTVLAVKIRAKKEKDQIDLETLEAVQKDQINSIKDLAIQYGGYLVMSYAHYLVVYFGYPESDDSSARRAGKTALFIRDEMKRRNENLRINFGITFHTKIAIHTGEVLIKSNEIPEGVLPEIALEQLNVTPINSVLCSQDSEQLLRKNYYIEKLHSQNSQDLQGDFYELIKEKEADTLSSTLSSLVGRATEKKQLIESWTSFKETKNTTLCLLQGEAGMGKSSLIANFSNALKQEQNELLLLQSVPEGKNSALKPFLSCLLQYVNPHKKRDAVAIAGLTTLAKNIPEIEEEQQVAVLCAWLGLNYNTQVTHLQLSPQKQKQIVFQFLTSFLNNRYKGESYALVVEDVHWLDPTSLELLQVLANTPNTSFYLLLSSREKHEFKAENIVDIQLEAMSVKETELLCIGALGTEKIEEKVLNYIHQKANGIPLFVEELTTTLVEQNFLKLEPNTNTYVLSNIEQLDTIPIKLTDLLHARLDQLLVAKPIAQAASVLGRFFKPAFLKKVTQIDDGDLENALLELLQTKTVVEDPQQEGSYMFRHALIRDAAYNSILNEQRKALHLKVAEGLEKEQHKENVFEIARHYGYGQDYGKAVDLGKKAAKIAFNKSMNQEALEMCSKVKQWILSTKIFATDYDLLLGLETIKINAMMAVYGWTAPQVKEAALEAFKLMEEQNLEDLEPNTITEVFWALNSYYHIAGERVLMRELSIRFMQVAKELSYNELMISALLCEGMYMYLDGFSEDAKISLEKAYNIILDQKEKIRTITTDVDSEVYILSYLSQVYWQLDEKEKARNYSEKAIELAISLALKASICLALLFRLGVYFYDGEKEGANSTAEKLIALANTYGLIVYSTYGYAVQSWANNNLETIDGVIVQLEQMGLKIGLTAYKAFAADVVYNQGNVTNAVERIEECLLLCEENQEFYFKKKLLQMKLAFTGNVVYDK